MHARGSCSYCFRKGFLKSLIPTRMQLSKRWIRQILKVVLICCVFVVLIIGTDFYLNFLPTTLQTRLPLHQPGSVVVDIKVVKCMTVVGCQSEEKEGWYRVPKNLYLDKYWTKGFLFSKRIHEEELKDDTPVVLDAALATRLSNEVPEYVVRSIVKQKGVSPSEVTVEKAAENGWRRKGDGFPSLWVKMGKYQARSSVTAVDVLFGRDAVDPRPGWSLKDGSMDPSVEISPRISIRVGPRIEPDRAKLKADKDGRYKIMQVADLHFSTGVGECMDPVPEPQNGEKCEADPRTLAFLERLLDEEKPDFIVLTGDQIFGSEAPDPQSAMYKAVAPFIRRKLPYAMVFGNHDDEGPLNKQELMELVVNLPYSVSEPGPEDIDGVGNYALQVQGPRSENPALTLYFLDSHKHLPKQRAYDWIKDNQLEYIQHEYDTKLHPQQKESSHIHLSMAFFHIPLTEYATGKNKFIGSYKEGSTAPRVNSGGRDKLANIGVTAISVGHDHVNDFCMFDEHEGKPSIWLCHGGGVGEGGYGGYGDYIRRCRFFEFDTQSGSVNTWKLKNEVSLKRFDQQQIVYGGTAVPPDS
jgi:hypothetical protein